MEKLHLISLPHSPECEIARWAFDGIGESYVEERYPPFQESAPLRKMGAGSAVPAAIFVANKDVLRDLDAILKYVDEQLPENSKIFPLDSVVGPWVRDFCTRSQRELAHLVPVTMLQGASQLDFFNWCTEGTLPGAAKKFKFWAPLYFFFIKKKYHIHADGFADAIKEIGKFFAVADQMFEDGRRFLFANRMTAADITFCSYAAAILRLAEYGGSRIDVNLAHPTVDAEIKKLRNTRVGTYVTAVYRKLRKSRL